MQQSPQYRTDWRQIFTIPEHAGTFKDFFAAEGISTNSAASFRVKQIIPAR